MRYIVDKATNLLIPAANAVGDVATASAPSTVMGGTVTPVELQFVDVDATGLQVPIRYPDGTVISWGLKKVGEFTAPDFVLQVASFTRPDTEDGYYTGWLDTSVLPVRTDLGDTDEDLTNDKANLPLAGEITILRPTQTIPDRTAQYVYLTVLNYYSQGTEATSTGPSPVVGTQRGSAAIANGAAVVTVVFATPVPGDYDILSRSVRNTTDATPLVILVGTLTAKSSTGFTFQLSGPTDSGNYVLDFLIGTVPVTVVTAPALSDVLAAGADGNAVTQTNLGTLGLAAGKAIKIGGIQVVGPQQGAIADVGSLFIGSGGDSVDLTSLLAQLGALKDAVNSLLAERRAAGGIAT